MRERDHGEIEAAKGLALGAMGQTTRGTDGSVQKRLQQVSYLGSGQRPAIEELDRQHLHSRPVAAESSLDISADVLEQRQYVLTVVDQPHAESYRRIEVAARFVPALAARDHRLGDCPGEDDLELELDIFVLGLGGSTLGRIRRKRQRVNHPGVISIAHDLDLGHVPAA